MKLINLSVCPSVCLSANPLDTSAYEDAFAILCECDRMSERQNEYVKYH